MAMRHSLIARRRLGPQTQWRTHRKTLSSGLGLDPPLFNYWTFLLPFFSFTLAHSRISHEYSSLFIIVINLIFMFLLWCIDWVGSRYANRFFMPFCITSSIGTHVEIKGKRKVQGVPQLQATALTRHHEVEEIDKPKQAQIKQTYKKH